MSQINLGMLYGIAFVSLAWTYMFDGCRRGIYKSIFLAYGLVLILVIYKSQLFVASSFLILIFPCIFFLRLKLHWRILLGLFFSLVFFSVIHYSQSFESIPVLRLDCSGIGFYVKLLLGSYEPGPVKEVFDYLLLSGECSRPEQALSFVGMLLLSSFGLWLVAWPVVGYFIRAKIPACWFYFPLLILVNYLLMSVGLALDSHHVGELEELLNRPFSWAYFVLAIWISAGGYFLLFGDSWPKTKQARTILLIVLGCFLFATLHGARNIQTIPAWPKFNTYQAFNAYPDCLMKAVDYIRLQGSVDDLLQDSENDPYLMVSALAERQEYAANTPAEGKNQPLQRRLQELKSFTQLQDAESIRAFAVERKITWYLLQPKTLTAWPEVFLTQTVFDCQGYRIFRFGQ
jgi:hypothetical protein